jgi:hypothetical protein
MATESFSQGKKLWKDIRIYFNNDDFFHFGEVTLSYLPDVARPEFLYVESKYLTKKIPFHSIACIVPFCSRKS